VLATGAGAATGALAAGTDASAEAIGAGAEAGHDEPPQLSRSRDRIVSSLLFIFDFTFNELCANHRRNFAGVTIVQKLGLVNHYVLQTGRSEDFKTSISSSSSEQIRLSAR
jgi:hypothetical protein